MEGKYAWSKWRKWGDSLKKRRSGGLEDMKCRWAREGATDLSRWARSEQHVNGWGRGLEWKTCRWVIQVGDRSTRHVAK